MLGKPNLHEMFTLFLDTSINLFNTLLSTIYNNYMEDFCLVGAEEGQILFLAE